VSASGGLKAKICRWWTCSDEIIWLEWSRYRSAAPNQEMADRNSMESNEQRHLHWSDESEDDAAPGLHSSAFS